MDTFIDVSFYLRFAIKIKNVPLPMPYIIPEDITSIISSIVTAHFTFKMDNFKRVVGLPLVSRG